MTQHSLVAVRTVIVLIGPNPAKKALGASIAIEESPKVGINPSSVVDRVRICTFGNHLRRKRPAQVELDHEAC